MFRKSFALLCLVFSLIGYADERSMHLINQADYGNQWPFTVPFGELNCHSRTAGGYAKRDITLTFGNKAYAINGSARGKGLYPGDLNEIWRDDPERPGSKLPVSSIIEKGLTFCN